MTIEAPKKNIPIVTMGRAGSTYVRDLLLKNLGVSFEEWFSPNFYKVCEDAGDTKNKNEYLGYVCEVIAGRYPQYGIKITPDILADNFWDKNIINDELFLNAFRSVDHVIFLVRLNPADAIKSFIYSEISGYWHSTQQETFHDFKNIDRDELSSFSLTRIFEYINDELTLFNLINYCYGKFSVYFYEDLLANNLSFSENILLRYGGTNNPTKILLPDIYKIKKNPHLFQVVSKIVDNFLLCNNDLQEMMASRKSFFRNNNFYSYHYSLM